MALLSSRDLTLGYEGQAVLRNVSFTVEAGDYLCIVGENGSGKSTLMRTILGLMKPLSGEILRGDGLLPGEIGYLPQQTLVQRDFPATVKEIVLSGCQGHIGLRPFYSRAERQLARENMERMGISPFARRCYRNLSGGQQQRVLLARALCATRRLLLLDEPVSGLDPLVTAEMYSLISRLNREGVTVIMISHDFTAAVRDASHILHVGSEVFFGPVAAYRASALYRRFLPAAESAREEVPASPEDPEAPKKAEKDKKKGEEKKAGKKDKDHKGRRKSDDEKKKKKKKKPSDASSPRKGGDAL